MQHVASFGNMTSMQLAERLLVPELNQTSELISNIQRKQELLAAGDPAHEDFRTALIIGGGAMRGVFSGGVVTGLEDAELTEVFDDVIGVSVGASTDAYFLAGQARLGTTLFSEELTSKEFINLTRFKNILSVDYLETIFTTGNKVLDLEAVRENRSRFYIGVTNINKARPEYIDVSESSNEEIIRFIQASSAVPGLAPPVVIDGVAYGDGITTCKNPIKFAIEELGATDILCIVNQPLRYIHASSIGDKVLSALLTKGYSPQMREAFSSRHEDSDEMAETVYSPDIRIGVICPESESIGRLTRNAGRLIQVAQRAEEYTKNLFKTK